MDGRDTNYLGDPRYKRVNVLQKIYHNLSKSWHTLGVPSPSAPEPEIFKA